MFKKLAGIFGDPNEKELRRLRPIVDRINALEPDFERRSDDGLRAKSVELRDRLHSGESPDNILPEAFATVREAARRTLGQRHFDVQLLGGIVLHQGKIAEMKTGEGKTLAATLPIYLNSLSGKGVHLVTVNDYLSKRDAQWMGPIYNLLGVSVGCIQHDSAFLFDPSYDSGDAAWPHLRPVSRREAYLADVTYGTNNEFGFDYLRDNMVPDPSLRVQRGFNFSIVDEVDNILIDEARTPLIISGQAEESTQRYYTFARLIPRLQPDRDYTVDERMRAAILTEPGIARMEKWLGIGNLYDPENYALVHYMENALRAHVFYRRDREYVVKDGEVIIVDEFTGRLMQGRRYSDGLHQAIEAKEGVKIQRESRTMATITFQNYFRMYDKLAGMTGTAATEAEEFFKIYKLDVVAIPTHRPLIRIDYEDQIYKNEEAKFRAVVREIEGANRQGRPVLMGTVSIEKSEHLSEMLTRQGIPHQVLNAKYHEKEARIISQAGRLGAVTIATNMAGRGVDIILGGNPQDREQGEWQEEHLKVVELGGLHVIGTEHHEARRIDNQLRGRAGRQGDPGSSRFYVSLEDDIMRRFGGDKIKGFMEWAGFDENTPIEHSLVSRAIENTQVKVEAYHFDVRKHLLDYDDVLNRHRESIYSEREKLLNGADLKSNIRDMIDREISDLVLTSLADEHGDDWNLDWLLAAVGALFPLAPDINKDNLARMSRSEIEEKLLHYAGSVYEKREQEIGAENMRMLERLVMLRSIDTRWVEHLTALDDVRRGIALYAYAQRDPLVAYKKEAHEMFQHLQAGIQRDIVHTIYHAGILKETPQSVGSRQSAVGSPGGGGLSTRVGQKVGRNDPCPCGSGKKYKKCCGR
ncbi:preprotein translocase subunit SecA [Dehalococcoidia bacterium]|nr:preprotein translocase subunit SecA [Dehalococcoidia bacterium]